jgi:hypothetical protein
VKKNGGNVKVCAFIGERNVHSKVLVFTPRILIPVMHTIVGFES